MDESINQKANATRSFYVLLLMTVKETAVTITRGLDYHSDNSRSKETIGTIRSNTNRGLLRSFNGALKDYNSLSVQMRCLPFNAFKMS